MAGSVIVLQSGPVVCVSYLALAELWSEFVTPQIIVAADDDHTRTRFAHLPGVVEGLERTDLSPLASASFVCLGCYKLIERAALRVIEAGAAAEVPMLLNLCGSDLSEIVVGPPGQILDRDSVAGPD